MLSAEYQSSNVLLSTEYDDIKAPPLFQKRDPYFVTSRTAIATLIAVKKKTYFLWAIESDIL